MNVGADAHVFSSQRKRCGMNVGAHAFSMRTFFTVKHHATCLTARIKSGCRPTKHLRDYFVQINNTAKKGKAEASPFGNPCEQLRD